jgi:hypothetical protein
MESSGLAAEIATTVVDDGVSVEIVGRVGSDSAGDAVILSLAQRGVGHVAVLRDSGRPTEVEPLPAPEESDASIGAAFEPPSAAQPESPTVDAADVELALKYLPEYRVIVVAERLDEDALRVVSDAARWSGASLVVVGRAEDLAGLPEEATVFEPPEDGDPDGAFAAMVGTYAAGLDRGEEPGRAFAAASAAVGSTSAEPGS